jgi:endonuclease/exonuclease/phosphatase family metal-dependent hydrolase
MSPPPNSRPSPRRLALIIIVVGLLIISVVSYLFWQQGQSPLPGVPVPGLPKHPVKPTRVAKTMKIATWNLRNLGPRTPVDLRARVLRDFDFVGVQEVDSLIGLEHLVAELTHVSGVVWQSVDSGREVGKGGASEFYAFLYKTDLVEPIATMARGIVADPDDRFAREPFYASFRAGHFDFTAITVHITWGKDRSKRGDEVSDLAGVFDTLQKFDKHEHDIMLMGDFNTDGPWQPAWKALRALGVTPVLADGHTTLSGTQGKEYASFYDNIWLDVKATREFDGQSGFVPYHTQLFPADPAPNITARKLVSDHLPVWAEFNITGPDDD